MSVNAVITDEHTVAVAGELTVISPDVCPDHVICPQVTVTNFSFNIGRAFLTATYDTNPRVRDWWRQRDDEFSPWSAWVLIHIGFSFFHVAHNIGTGLTQGSTHDFQFRFLPGAGQEVLGFPEIFPTCGDQVFRVTQGTAGGDPGSFIQWP